MDEEPTGRLLWRIKATIVLGRLNDAENRFAASLTVNQVSTLAAADELAVASRDAAAWMAANSCPDMGFGERVALMVNTCSEVAFLAQRAILDNSIDAEAVIRRLRELLAIIDFTSETLDTW